MKNVISLIFTFVIFVLTYSVTQSQPQQEWVARYNSPENYNETVVDMEIDNKGNVYILGYNNYFVTIKYNNNGILEWVRKYKGPTTYPDKSSDMVLDDSGNVYITGSSYSTTQGTGKKAIVVIKYNKNGDTLWTKRFINNDSIECKSNKILFDYNNNIIVTGQCYYNAHSNSITVLKYDIFGNFKDSILYPNSQTFSSILDASKNLYVLGAVGQSNVKIIKYDTLGNILKEISDTVHGYKIYIDNNFNIITSGRSETGTTRIDIGTSKYDSTGHKIWFSYYHHNSLYNNDYYRDFTIDDFGNVYVTGASTIGMELAWDIVTIKYNQNGDSLWVQRYDSIYNSSDNPASITTDKSGNVIVAGYTNFNLLANSYITICYDSTGNQKFVLFYNNGLPFHSHSASIVKTDSLGNIYATGISQNANGDFDIATIKYSVLSNINPISNIIPRDSKLYQNYPNPFNSNTKIRFAISRAGIIELAVYDILGRKLQTLFNGYKQVGIFETDFDSQNLTSGIYFYRLSLNGKIIGTKKMNFIK